MKDKPVVKQLLGKKKSRSRSGLKIPSAPSCHKSNRNKPTPRKNKNLQVVFSQLGRWPEISFDVKIMCPHGSPAVIENAPYHPKGQPNPNIYYLTCPFLVSSLSRLEAAGAIKEIQDEISSDQSLADSVDAAQNNHMEYWQKKAQEHNKAEAGWFRIAASKKHHLIKCLHAHYAYFLAVPDYSLGKVIDRLLHKRWCEKNDCLHFTRNYTNDIEDGKDTV